MLRSDPRRNIRVFVIWEPVLITDWRRPGVAHTAFVPDQRATHFWDSDHRLSALYGGRERLEAAAARAIDIGALSYASLRSILDHKLDRQAAHQRAADGTPIVHSNIRGARYYH